MATTITQVKDILPASTQLTDAQITAAIAAATCITDELALSCTISQDCLDQVCIYLAAHFASVTDKTISLKSEKDACAGGSLTYGTEFGKGIMGTTFGQMANTLSGGCLAEFDKRPIAIHSIGELGNSPATVIE